MRLGTKYSLNKTLLLLKLIIMKCPNCNETLLIAERHQVEIDYCPNCRGVWLDRGELDKLLNYVEKNDSSSPPYREQSSSHGSKNYYTSDRSKYQSDKQTHENDNYAHNHRKKKKSFLSDLFDFD